MQSEKKISQSAALGWFEKYADYLFAYSMQRVRDAAAAEDLVQETFLAALQSAESFAGGSTEKTWLTGILKHKIYDYFRKSNRQAGLSPEEADLSGYDYFFERTDEWDGHWNAAYAPADWDAASPLRHVETHEFQAVFAVCLMNLPERVANAFVMREVDGLTSREICDVLMISLNNYWTIMHRARLHLRRCLEMNWFFAPNDKEKGNL